ncbi:uncharacterized protein LOC144439123 [Glandiceps talaboti]
MTTTLDGLNNNTELMVGICSMLEFYNDPPTELFQSRYESGIKRIYQDEEKMNVFIQSPGYRGYFPKTSGRVVKVETLEELEIWTEKLQSKPILMDVHCRRVARTTSNQSEQVVRDGYFAVIINPNNPHMKGQIETALDGARTAFKAEERFIFEIDVRSIVMNWFSEQVKESVRCEYGHMTVANTYVYEDIESMFCSDMALCSGCFICSSPVYTIHRLLLCRTFTVDLSGRASEFTLRFHMDETTSDSDKNSMPSNVDNGKAATLRRESSIDASPIQSVSLCVPTSIEDAKQENVPEKPENPTLYEVTRETTADNVNLVVYNV